MVSEKQYYKPVEKFINKRYNCIKTGIGKGSLSLGLVDVIGTYETSSEFHSDVEVIVVEVKTTTQSFGKSLGQALGYSVYGEICYLAVTFKNGESFSKDQQYMAAHLGVGLIKIPTNDNGKPKNNKIEIVTNSDKHKSIIGQKQYILHAIGITKCSSCNVYGLRENMYKIKKSVASKALFTNSDFRKIYLCNQCYTGLIPAKERLKKETIKETGRKAAKTRKYREAARKAVKTRREKKSMSEEL